MLAEDQAIGLAVKSAGFDVALSPVVVRNIVVHRSVDRALDLLTKTVEALRAERGEDYPIRGSLVKQAIKRQNPGFNERAHGFRAFNELLLEAQKRGLLKLEDDKQAGTYIVHAVE